MSPIVRTLVLILLLVPPAITRAAASDSLSVSLKSAESAAKAGKWKDAAQHWTRVVDANPVNADYWEQLALARYSAKEYEEAVPAFEKALELRAGYPFHQAYNIACCYALMREKEAALNWLRKSMDLGLRDLKHAREDSDLASLRDDPRFKEMFAVVDTSRMSRDEGYRYDIRLLNRELKRVHFNLRRGIRAGELDAETAKLLESVPSLSEEQIMVAMMRLVRLADDGHTSLGPARGASIPLRLFQFKEGLFVAAAAKDHRDLVGAQILKIEGESAEKVIKEIEELAARDNAMGPKVIGPLLLMRYPQLLKGLGIGSHTDRLSLLIRDLQSKERSVEVAVRKEEPTDSWHTLAETLTNPPLYLKNREAPYWFEYLPDQKLLYWQYNSVRNNQQESIKAFCARLFKFVEENPVERLVLDLRWNGGGNTFLNAPIIHGLIKCDKINQPGKLFVIVGRGTFSAAQNAATSIERNTRAIFVGEPTGSSPNFVGETILITLPYSKMVGSISDLYWQSSWPMDYRTWIAPHLYAPPTFASYRAGRDPALEAIQDYSGGVVSRYERE